jgi:hypothetical protein
MGSFAAKGRTETISNCALFTDPVQIKIRGKYEEKWCI